MKGKKVEFKMGDKVRINHDCSGMKKGDIGVLIKRLKKEGLWAVREGDINNHQRGYSGCNCKARNWEKINSNSTSATLALNFAIEQAVVELEELKNC